MNSDTTKSPDYKSWLLIVAAGIALILVVANISLARHNQAAQAEINDRLQYIDQTIRVSRLNTGVIQALANSSAKSNDLKIRKLLADHGIHFSAAIGEPPVQGIAEELDTRQSK